MDTAREAGANLAMAMIDIDAPLHAHRATAAGKSPLPFRLLQEIKQREKNRSGW
jgi:hypothetical protein